MHDDLSVETMESLVEDFFAAIGYRKHEEIKFRQGRIDLTLVRDGKPLLVAEVKRNWALSGYNDDGAIQQAYHYAHEVGARYILITNGDYYLLCDRLHGLTYEHQKIGEFRLSSLQEDQLRIIDVLRPDGLTSVNARNLLLTLSECF